jgi:hypothetical protein
MVRETNFLPFGCTAVVQLIVVTSLPLLPLLLTMMPLEELVTRIFRVIF